jgi:alkanesulfonate monooxygenase SsuD/methylene tetrahydromethanopterin reductase-like flavin-dependent oxidoreductase (luciferase family)
VPDYGQDLQFGVFITPIAEQADEVIRLAESADVAGLDLVTFQDHPYQAKFLDTWTLLSFLASRTSAVRLAPNVANLPLRHPVVLARSVASLDVLSGGRVELGIGAGAFWDAIAANAGPRMTPGEGVDALGEAVEIIRAVWDTSERSIRISGEHYDVQGAHPGPAPAHDIELWIGAYKPRMLRLTGAKADGWLPSTAYLEMGDLPAMNERIDRAAEEAGRAPVEIRRMLNLDGSFGGSDGFPRGSASEWVEQLTELTLASGMSAYILAASSDDDIRRFAAEVAPAVRERVQAERERGEGEGVRAAPPAEASTEGRAPLAAAATPDDGARLSDERVWDESTRPTIAREPAEYTEQQQAAGRHLIDVHDALRAELERLRDLVEQVSRGQTDPNAVRSFLNRMTIRQNHWTLGAFCESYCRVVTNHHTLEDRSVFPHLSRSDPDLAPVIKRLEDEHETIADLLERVDGALVALVAAEEDGFEEVRRTVDVLSDALLSHFSYEERELIEPLARHGFY